MGIPRKCARGAVNELESRAGATPRFAGFEARANDVLPRSPVAFESRKRCRFDEAQLVEPIPVNVANALSVVFLLKACPDQLGQRGEKTRPDIAAPRDALDLQRPVSEHLLQHRIGVVIRQLTWRVERSDARHAFSCRDIPANRVERALLLACLQTGFHVAQPIVVLLRDEADDRRLAAAHLFDQITPFVELARGALRIGSDQQLNRLVVAGAAPSDDPRPHIVAPHPDHHQTDLPRHPVGVLADDRQATARYLGRHSWRRSRRACANQLRGDSERDREQKSEAHQKLRASDTPARLKAFARLTLVFLADAAISTPGVASACHWLR